jgi:hypothetical protein
MLPMILGRRANGDPIYLVTGAAEANFDKWIPEEFGSAVIQRVMQTSAIERYATHIPMSTQTRSTPRSGGVAVGIVAKGGTYAEDTTTNDEVVLSVQKFGEAIRIAEEDINDSLADIIATKQIDWATSYAKMLDNACLGVTVTKATTGCKFDSLYYLLSQTDSNTGYTANANITQTATGGPQITYAQLSTVCGRLRAGRLLRRGQLLVIAHPKYKAQLRTVVDSQSRPIFNEGTPVSPVVARAGRSTPCSATTRSSGRSVRAPLRPPRRTRPVTRCSSSATRRSSCSASVPAPNPSSSTGATAWARSPTSRCSRCAPAAHSTSATRTRSPSWSSAK